MNRRYLAPRALGPDDVVETFECRSVEQTQWLRRHARQANSSNSARVLVVTEPDHDQVVAYYAWAMASIVPTEVPARLRKGAGRHPQPVALLARLGVSAAHEGRGLGAALLQDVISRSVEIGQEIGCRGLLVHAESPQARDFYVHLIPEFEPSPTDELHLVLMMKDIMRTLR
ncbi:MAG: GNAT family N-acetyltransferase [Candidatus Microthrix sp.]|jgi:GNAT superfamily N-acetyltransferase|uniref:GNAT family N-acetyltransferase n=1 Tax=Candidatus Neomicrothrix subdominans TaxID=2954438 RepID=A0A936NA94_9ACTN|nr:GNAT family N-acetyltransferase [Candidatus Microthrix sp.]MBK6438580.1 GNAT family N-acetyltransferase [Candidatus Microthrix sp.]MBK6969060.1 GNAT family N-acetyltransferase [Candidatus Microthrix sp.]MBK7166142.1 GNAT family N-acetyltransferase [Candidatus Microthrix sp.]MBK9295778.1 GNAT family N-acetyltransferase [Candidatus Microthrix subdominans]